MRQPKARAHFHLAPIISFRNAFKRDSSLRPFSPGFKNKGDEDSDRHLLILHALDIVDSTTTQLGLFLLLLSHLLARHLLGDLVALTLL